MVHISCCCCTVRGYGKREAICWSLPRLPKQGKQKKPRSGLWNVTRRYPTESSDDLDWVVGYRIWMDFGVKIMWMVQSLAYQMRLRGFMLLSVTRTLFVVIQFTKYLSNLSNWFFNLTREDTASGRGGRYILCRFTATKLQNAVISYSFIWHERCCSRWEATTGDYSDRHEHPHWCFCQKKLWQNWEDVGGYLNPAAVGKQLSLYYVLFFVKGPLSTFTINHYI